MGVENAPELSVVVVPTTVESNVTTIVSVLPKFVPLTVTLVVGGPDVTESVMLAVALAASVTALAEITQVHSITETNRIRRRCRNIGTPNQSFSERCTSAPHRLGGLFLTVVYSIE